MFEDPIMNTFFSLIVLVAVLGGVLIAVKRIVLKQRNTKHNAEGIEVLSKIPLQPKTNLFVVKVGGKKLLIGANDNSINTLADLTNSSIAKRQEQNKKIITGQKQQTTVSKPQIDPENLSFKTFLNQTFKKG